MPRGASGLPPMRQARRARRPLQHCQRREVFAQVVVVLDVTMEVVVMYGASGLPYPLWALQVAGARVLDSAGVLVVLPAVHVARVVARVVARN